MSHQLGFIGLGKMGHNMVLHLTEAGFDVIVFNRTREKADQLHHEAPDVRIAGSVKEIVSGLSVPRVIWLMVPNGSPVDEMIAQLIDSGIQKGDIVIDGGNCYYKDTVRRSNELAERGIHYIDCGTSGGLEGARHGACLMIGGDEDAVKSLDWLWKAVAVKDGYAYFGPSGAGHFVKMVHNGIEYGMNQAIGEGFEILADSRYSLNFAKIAHIWAHGSVIRGWLVELLAGAFDRDPRLDSYTGRVGGGETGKWTLETAFEEGVDAKVLEESLRAREKSMTNPTFAGKVVSALRAGYGGHTEPK